MNFTYRGLFCWCMRIFLLCCALTTTTIATKKQKCCVFELYFHLFWSLSIFQFIYMVYLPFNIRLNFLFITKLLWAVVVGSYRSQCCCLRYRFTHFSCCRCWFFYYFTFRYVWEFSFEHNFCILIYVSGILITATTIIPHCVSLSSSHYWNSPKFLALRYLSWYSIGFHKNLVKLFVLKIFQIMWSSPRSQ